MAPAGTAASSFVFGEDPQLVAAAVGTVLPLAIVAPAEVLRCLVTEAVQDTSKARARAMHVACTSPPFPPWASWTPQGSAPATK